MYNFLLVYNLIKSHNKYLSFSYSNWLIKSPFYIKNIRYNRIKSIKRFLDKTR